MFNMAVMGLRLAQRANGVSQLHGVVSREMFDGLWPGFDDEEVPITSVTNGVHAGTWVDRRVYELADKYLGTLDVERENAWDRIADVPRDADLVRPSASCASSSSSRPAAACGRRGRSAAPARPSSAGSTTSSTRTS